MALEYKHIVQQIFVVVLINGQSLSCENMRECSSFWGSFAAGTYVRRGRLDDDLTTHRDTNIIKEDFLVFFLSFFLSFLFLIHIFF